MDPNEIALDDDEDEGQDSPMEEEEEEEQEDEARADALFSDLDHVQKFALPEVRVVPAPGPQTYRVAVEEASDTSSDEELETALMRAREEALDEDADDDNNNDQDLRAARAGLEQMMTRGGNDGGFAEFEEIVCADALEPLPGERSEALSELVPEVLITSWHGDSGCVAELILGQSVHRRPATVTFDVGTVVARTNGWLLGRVQEVFGPVVRPMFVIHFLVPATAVARENLILGEALCMVDSQFINTLELSTEGRDREERTQGKDSDSDDDDDDDENGNNHTVRFLFQLDVPSASQPLDPHPPPFAPSSKKLTRGELQALRKKRRAGRTTRR